MPISCYTAQRRVRRARIGLNRETERKRGAGGVGMGGKRVYVLVQAIKLIMQAQLQTWNFKCWLMRIFPRGRARGSAYSLIQDEAMSEHILVRCMSVDSHTSQQGALEPPPVLV